MRTWGRTYDANNVPTWHEVTTDADGFDDLVWVVTLAQTLQLNLGESPFYGNYGIPQHQTVMQQVFPDYYIAYIQARFAPYFASLTVASIPSTDDFGTPYPHYKFNVLTNQGVQLDGTVPIPT